MTSSSRTLGWVVAASLAIAAQAHAQAPPTPADLETARDLYKQGRDLEKKGDLKGALDKLRAAHAVGRTPLTAIELARVEVQLGMVVEAREVCLGVARMPVASDESARSAKAREEAAKLAEDLKAKVATVVVELTGVTKSDHVSVSLDGVAIPDEALSEPRKVNPGKHVLVAHVDGGAEVEGSVEVAAAETKTVTLAPPPAPVVTKPPPEPTQPLPPQPFLYQPPPPRSHAASTGFAIVGFSVAAVGLIGGAVGGVIALEKSNDLDGRCAQGHCGPAQWNELDNARTAASISNAMFFVGGAGLLVGVLAIALRSPDRAPISARVGLGTLGVDGAF